MKKYPIYEIKSFKCSSFEENIYVNTMSEHIKENGFTNLPHGHSFYLILFFTAGTGKHWIDFEEFSINR